MPTQPVYSFHTRLRMCFETIAGYISQISCIGYAGCFDGCKIDIIFLLYNIGDALLDAILRPNIPQIVCSSLYPQYNTKCHHIEQHQDIEDEVQRQATTYLILHKLLTNCPALVLGMFCGAWSDKYGRKLPFVMPSTGTIFAVLFYMGANMSEGGALPSFLIGSVVHGCFGKTAMITMAANSYVTDITDAEKRTKKLGFLAAMQFIGMCFGSLLGGVLIDTTSILTTYLMVSVLNILVVVLALGILKETIQPIDEGDCLPCSSFCRFSNVTDSIKVLTRERDGNKRKGIIALFAVLLLHQTCRTGLTDVTLLYTERSPLSWPTSWFGYLSALDNASMGIVLLVLLPVFSNYLKLNDATISIIGMLCASVRFLILAWSEESWMVWLAVVVGSLAGIINSPVRSLLSKLVNENEIGKMFSILGTGETIAKFTAVVFTSIYGYTLNIFAGMPFVIAAILYTAMILLVLLMHVKFKSDRCEDLDSNKTDINGTAKHVKLSDNSPEVKLEMNNIGNHSDESSPNQTNHIENHLDHIGNHSEHIGLRSK